MDVSSCLHIFLLVSSVSGLILPLTKPNGDPDLASIINHMTLMEQTMTSLQTQVQTTNSKLQATEIELNIVKANLQTTGDELKVVKSDLKSAETDLAILKHDFQKGSDSNELTNLKSEFEALKMSYNFLVQQINITVIDSVSRDVKSNIREIQSLNTRQNTTEKDLTTTKSVVKTAVSDVKIVQSQVNSISGDVNTLSQQVKGVKNQIETGQTKQNITDQDLTATTALVQLTSAELKSIKSQVNSVSGDLNVVVKDLAEVKNKTDKDVAFQVTQRASGTSNGWSILKFDSVDYNTDGGYDNSTGMFTAPVSGTYIFWANVFYASPIRQFYTYIKKGQQTLASGYYKIGDNSFYGVASSMTVAHVDKGEQVHFTTDATDDYIFGYDVSSYGGALLHAV